jgi:hypothetical protein
MNQAAFNAQTVGGGIGNVYLDKAKSHTQVG